MGVGREIPFFYTHFPFLCVKRMQKRYALPKVHWPRLSAQSLSADDCSLASLLGWEAVERLENSKGKLSAPEEGGRLRQDG